MANDLILVESATRRNEVMEGVAGDEKALEAMNKAKALVMAMWQGRAVATTEQIAEFYGVPVHTALSALKNYRSEFESDGLRIVKGEELKDLKYQLAKGVSNDDTPLRRAKSAVAWTPRSALRLGMVLRDSEVAKQVRSLLLDVAQSANPAKVTPAPKLKEELPALSLQDAAFAVDLIAQKLRRSNVDEGLCHQWEIQSLGTLCPQLKAILPEARKMIQSASPLDGGMAPMIPSDIAKIINERTGKKLSARDINAAAYELKWQVQRISHGGKKKWDLTEEGKNYGKQYPFTNQQTGHSDSQIKWSQPALEKFEAFFTGEDLISGWEEAQ